MIFATYPPGLRMFIRSTINHAKFVWKRIRLEVLVALMVHLICDEMDQVI